MDRRRIKGLKARLGREHCISRERPDGPSSTGDAYQLEKSEEEDTVLVDVRSPEEAGTQLMWMNVSRVMSYGMK